MLRKLLNKRRNPARSWLQKNIKPSERNKIAKTIIENRRAFTTCEKIMTRDFNYLLENHAFDMKSFIQQILLKKKRIKILDSGAGYFGITRDIKQAFGEKVKITALGLNYPGLSQKAEATAIKEIQQLNYNGRIEEAKELERRLLYAKQSLANSRNADVIKVMPLENFEPREKFDLIIDFYGPSTYPLLGLQRTIQVYSKILSKNGIILTLSPLPENMIQKYNLEQKIISRKKAGNPVYIITRKQHAAVV